MVNLSVLLRASMVRKFSSNAASAQASYMTNEICLCVDGFDRVIGHASKQECHLVTNGSSKLHRAFSWFLFRQSTVCGSTSDGLPVQLLLQRRAASKITFPNLWSNTCCSHPITNFPGEEEETEALGVRRAVQRKAKHELGIPSEPFIPLSNVHFLTRIRYFADNILPPTHSEENRWAEHELDYLLVSVLDSESACTKEIDQAMSLNPDEVSASHWAGFSELEKTLSTTDFTHEQTDSPPLLDSMTSRRHFTPWFRGLFDNGYLQRLWSWVEAYYSKPFGQSRKFVYENYLWDRATIDHLSVLK